jgi:hypothetical protein
MVSPYPRTLGEISMSDEILALHSELFGFTPKKPGIAYERVAAVVLAVLGWQEVTHDVHEQPVGRLADHQLDVVARHPSGDVNRLIVECKDYAKTVGEEVLNTLVGVRQQVGADAAAVITTKGFKKGARNVAVDENIALIRLRHFAPEAADKGYYVMKVVVTMDALFPTYSDFDVVLGPHANLQNPVSISLTGNDRLLYTDGSSAERLIDILEEHSAFQQGKYQRRAEFDDGRLIVPNAGPPVPIVALVWSEELVPHTNTFESVLQGTPVLAVEQLDGNGAVTAGRLVVSEDLYAWEINGAGQVQPKGQLARPA